MVTGAASGIGRALARRFAEAGASVLVHTRSNRVGAEQVLAELRSLAPSGVAPSPMPWLADLGDPEACAALVRAAWAERPVDAWVNNAGADILTGEARDWSFERKLERLYAVDLRGTMLLSRAVGDLMRERGRGVIVNIGWDQAATGMEGEAVNCSRPSRGG